MNNNQPDFKLLNDLLDKNIEATKAKNKNVMNQAYSKIRQHMTPNLLPNLELWIASHPLIRNSSGKYDAELTLAAITNENLRQAIKFIYRAQRSVLYFKVRDKSTYCALVPLFLAAHKRHNDVKYEEWDKTSKYFSFLVGKSLWQGLEPWFNHDFSDVNVEEMRGCLDKGLDMWCKKTMYYNDEALTTNKWIRYLITQTWMAHVSKRHEYMILDVNDWDNMPEAFDETIEEVVEEEISTLEEPF